jgi:hypothetical protein
VKCASEARRGTLDRSTVVLTAVATIPVAWLLVRRYFV